MLVLGLGSLSDKFVPSSVVYPYHSNLFKNPVDINFIDTKCDKCKMIMTFCSVNVDSKVQCSSICVFLFVCLFVCVLS